MKFLRQMIPGALILALAAMPLTSRADAGSNATPDFQEVYDLLRTHLTGESETDLNREAVQGLLQQLHSKVSLVNSQTAPEQSSHSLVLTKSALYDGPIAYLRVGRIGEGLANQITTAFKQLESSTNHLKGLVLDLRFADGHDYAEAVAVADLFITKQRPLLDWGHGVVESKPAAEPISLPMTVLVNHETKAAAEALAAMLRGDERAILIGSSTAGEASMSQEFPLKNGQYLRIATAAVKLGNGETLSSNGVSPDIKVAVKPGDERAYYEDPFKELPASNGLLASILGDSATATNGTNRAAHARQINEAELMRQRKANPGAELDGSTPLADDGEAAPEKPVIRDPALGRALDLVKGIAVVRQAHSS